MSTYNFSKVHVNKRYSNRIENEIFTSLIHDEAHQQSEKFKNNFFLQLLIWIMTHVWDWIACKATRKSMFNSRCVYSCAHQGWERFTSIRSIYVRNITIHSDRLYIIKIIIKSVRNYFVLFFFLEIWPVTTDTWSASLRRWSNNNLKQ